MSFAYDLRKSKTNMEKHGIDFVQAQLLWGDPRRKELPAKGGDEERSLLVGKINDKYWTAIFTYREDTVRLISVRRARKKEVQFYES